MDNLINQLEALDQKAFLYFNGLHHPVLDEIMFWFSDKLVWIPFYALLLFLIILKYKVKAIYILLAIGLMITACDQFTSGFMKPAFERLRPCYEPALEGMVHLVKGCGGSYGFASSHAANTFGLSMFVWLLFKTFSKWVFLIFLWATVVSYSRVYLGVHYPLDIIIGGMVGLIFAYLIFRLLEWWISRKYNYKI